METLGFLFFIVSFLVAIVFLIISRSYLLGVMSMLVLVLIYIALFVNVGTRPPQITGEEVIKEVNLNLVPLKGDCQFSSQIRINFRDGKLRSINLIPNTTKPLE